SGNDERTGLLRLDGSSASGQLVFHLDALHRETGDYRIPGHAESALARAQAHDAEAEEDHGGHGAYGRLPNSFVRSDSAALRLSWIGERGFVGAGPSLFHSRYGVPGPPHGGGDHPAHHH